MRAGTELLMWKTVALGSLLLCGTFWWRSDTADARGVARSPQETNVVGRKIAERRSESWADRHEGCPRTLSAAIEEATRPTPRCAAIARFSRCRQIDAEGVERIARYTNAKRSPEVRTCATSALGETQLVAALPVLVGLVDDAEPMVAEAALRAIALFEHPDARRALIETTRHERDELRMLALTLLTERRDPQALPLIAEALTAGGASLREQLIWLLGTTHDARALPILSGELHRGPRSVQRAALSAIGEIGGEGAGRVLLGVIESLPSLAAPALEALSRTGAEDCVETLLSAARGELGAQVSPIALQALVQHESPEVTALMQQELLGDNPSRVSVAMDYLASHAVRAAVPDILRIARETGQAHVWSAVNALSRIGGAEALAGLEQLASLPGATGQTASEALANLPGAKGRAHGTARAQGADSDPWQTLERLNGDSSPEASTALIDMARGTDPGLSAQALAYLAQREDPESLEAVAALAARGKTPAQRAMALSALGQSGHPNSATILREALRDPSSEVRAQAVQVLAESNSTELELGLLSASRDENPEVVGIATSALAQLATPSAVARLEEIANGRLAQVKPQALHALASIAPARAAGFAERMAASGDRDASLAATQVANTFPRQVSVRILSSALTQGDADVSREALAALSQLGLSKSELTRMIDPLLRDTQLPEDLRSSAEQLLQGARE